MKFDTPSKLELNMSQKHPLGIEKVTSLVPSTFESNPWVLLLLYVTNKQLNQSILPPLLPYRHLFCYKL